MTKEEIIEKARTILAEEFSCRCGSFGSAEFWGHIDWP